MFAAIGMMTCPNLAVPAEVMRHVVDVESGANPYAIGVVGGRLVRQPKNLGEALATVHMLDAKGYNYSLGIVQVNRANLGKYGLDSYEKAFEACPNLSAGAQILAACYGSSGGDWGKAFSCYYSGNFVTGYRDGYVQKVYDSINRDAGMAAGTARAIPLEPASKASTVANSKTAALTPDSPGYRTAIRSVAFYSTTTSAVPAGNPASSHGAAPQAYATQGTPAPAPTSPAAPLTPPPPAPASPRDAQNTAAASVFVPQVTGPNDPLPVSTSANHAASPQVASTAAGAMTHDQEGRDAAFVF